MKWTSIALLSAVCSASLPAYASEIADNNKGLYIVPLVNYHFLDDKGNIDDLASLGLNLGYQWDQNWALELGFQAGSTQTEYGDDADMISWQADALYSLQSHGDWQPYVVGTLMDLSFDVDKTRHETLMGLGIGSYYRLTDTIRLRGDARGLYSHTDNLIDTALAFGVQFTFGGSNKVAVQPIADKPHLYIFEVHFDTGSAVLLPEYKGHVEQLIAVLKHNPNTSITIEGDTDNTGSNEFNLHLSAERAESVKDMLVNQHGIHADRILIDAEGEAQPLADNATLEGRAENRRAVVKVRITHE